MEPTDSLTPQEKGTYDEFVIITGADSGNPETASKIITLLENHDYNLNNAIVSFFENGIENVVSNRRTHEPPSFDEETQAFASGLSTGPIHRNLQDEFVLDHLLPKLPKAPKISSTWQFDLGIHMSRRAAEAKEKEEDESVHVEERQHEPEKKSSFPWIIFLIIPKALSFIFSFFKFLLGLNTPSLYKSLPRLFNYDNYSEEYLLERDLDIDLSDYQFNSSDFNKCHDRSQKDFDFVLALLVDTEYIPFARNMLQSEALHPLIGQNGEFKDTQLFVGNIDKSPEAFEVMQTYRPRRLPYLMLLGNVSNNPSVMSSMSVIYKSNLLIDDPEDNHTVEKVVRNVKKCMSNFHPQLVSKRFDKEEMELSRLLKTKQDEAYLESLEQDKVKKQEKQMKAQLEKEMKEFAAKKASFLKKIISSEWFNKQVEGATAKEAVRVSLKLPNGRRVIQKFKRSMPLSAIYVFVESQLYEPSGEEVEDVECEWELDEFCEKNKFNFEVFKPFPKLEIPSSNDTIDFFDQLKSGDNILVEYLAESESEDEADQTEV